MKTSFLILFAVSMVQASGPRYLGQTTTVDPKQTYANGYAEAVNIYHDISYPVISVGTASTMTVTSLTVTSETVKSLLTVPNGINSTDAAAFGQLKIIQIVSNTSTTGFSTTSSSFQDTNLARGITPTSASNKIAIIACGPVFVLTQATILIVTLERGVTNLLGSNGQLSFQSVSGGELDSGACLAYLDSPATTSTITYTVQIANASANGNTVKFGGTNWTSFILLAEVVQP